MSSANSSSFTSFSIWIPFISSLINMVRTSKTMLNDSGRSEHPFLVPDIKEMLSVFHHVWECLLWVCHIWPLLCWGRFPLCPLYGEFFFFPHKWVLNFVKCFFCIYWYYHIFFIFQFVNIVYHIGQFAYTKEYLHPWDKPHLTMVYDSLDVLLDSVLVFCWGFLHLCWSVILTCDCFSLSNFGEEF